MIDRVAGGDPLVLRVEMEASINKIDNFLLITSQTSAKLVTACAASTPGTLGGNDHT